MANIGRALKKSSDARMLVAAVLRAVEGGGDKGELDRAKVLIYGAKILGELINASEMEEEMAEMRKELTELKSKIGLRAV